MISIRLKHLSRSYGHISVFNDVNLEHNTGILGIAGPNGSGKSTLLKCMGGLLQPSGGNITWKKDDNLLSQAVLQVHLGYAAPYISMYKELTIRENLEFLAKLRKTQLKPDELTRLLTLVDISHVQNRLFGNLSTGQQQRARLASSIFHSPSVLLLDEPGSNLDKRGRDLIHGLTQKFRSEDKFVIIASNDEQELALCDRVFSIEHETFM